MGKERVVNVEQYQLPTIIHELNHLTLLLKSLQKLTICPGVSTENYKVSYPEILIIVCLKQLMGNLVLFLNVIELMLKRKSSDQASVIHFLFQKILIIVAKLVVKQIII
jgi:hypothetical protein